MTHTKGKVSLKTHPKYGDYLTNGIDDEYIGALSVTAIRELQKSNAELLEALKMTYEKLCFHGHQYTPSGIKAKQAIDKAEGREV